MRAAGVLWALSWHNWEPQPRLSALSRALPNSLAMPSVLPLVSLPTGLGDIGVSPRLDTRSTCWRYRPCLWLEAGRLLRVSLLRSGPDAPSEGRLCRA